MRVKGITERRRTPRLGMQSKYKRKTIDTKKQKRIIKSAEQYMRKTGCRLQPRFDAAYVSSYNGEDLSLEYILNAFDASGV